MKKVLNYNLKYLAIVILIFSSFSCIKFPTIKNYFIKDNIFLNNLQLQRLKNFLSGEFYSFEMQRLVYAYPIAFMISDDGKKSVILSCEGFLDECNHSVHIYQLIKKYEKKNNTKYKILAYQKKIILPEYAKIKVVKDLELSKKIKHNAIFEDKILTPHDSCSGDEC